MKFAQFCQWLSNHAGRPTTFLIAIVLIGMWAASGAMVSLQRYLAAHHQHLHNDHHLSDGFTDPEHP